MLNKKRIIIILIFLAVLVLVLYFVFFKKRETTQKTSSLPTPSIPVHFAYKLPLSFQVEKESFNFPKNLPLLELQRRSPLSEGLIDKIAGSLGFIEEPSTFKNVDREIVKFYNNDKYSLTVYPEERYLKLGPAFNPYDLIKNAINKQLTEEDMQIIARDFLVNNLLLEADDIKFMGINYLKADRGYEVFQTAGKDEGEIFQLNFSLSLSPYPIYSLNPQQTFLYVQLLKDGYILNCKANLENNYSPSAETVPLKDFSQVKASLDQAVLVSLFDGNINLPDLKEKDIEKIRIDSIELVYLMDNPKSKNMQPVFLLSGKAKVIGYEEEVNAFLYLPALSEK